MSRCFPFPPPGYKRNGICDEALIESIKLQREEEKTKKERKKEKKREKKHKENVGENGEIKHKNQSHKRRHKDERSQKDKKVGDDKKRRENEIEHFEKSGLTEELGHPVGSQNSSDSSLNSNKRQKHNSPPDGQHNPGSIIRIRLPTQRQKDPEILPSKEEPCSASGRADDTPAPRPGKEFGGEHPCSTSGGQELTLRLSKEKPCSSSQASEIFACKAETAPPSNLREIGLTPSMLLCSDLIENWVPPPVQSECSDFGDQEWLFERKQNHRPENKICKDLSNGLSHGNPTPWPRACYLPEADVYALPFTVPF